MNSERSSPTANRIATFSKELGKFQFAEPLGDRTKIRSADNDLKDPILIETLKKRIQRRKMLSCL